MTQEEQTADTELNNAASGADTEQPTGELSLQTICMPSDTNWMGDIFGGWLVSQMDIAGAIVARKRAKGRVTTVAIDDMVFHVPVQVGNVIACYTQIIRVGNTSITTFIEVWTVHDVENPPVKVTEGRFVYVAIDEAGQKRDVSQE